MDEEIKICGVNVSKCEFFDGSHLCKCDKTLIDEHKKLKNIPSVGYYNCRDNYNCYFKQLQRKIEEYNRISILLQNTDTYSEVCDTCKDEILIYPSISGKTNYTDNEVEALTLTKIINKLKCKTSECEHWKHQAELGSDTTDRLSMQLEQKDKECSLYKQALDEINNYIVYMKTFGDKEDTIRTIQKIIIQSRGG